MRTIPGADIRRSEEVGGARSEIDLELRELREVVVRILDVRSSHHVEGGGEEADEQAPEELCRASALCDRESIGAHHQRVRPPHRLPQYGRMRPKDGKTEGKGG